MSFYIRSLASVHLRDKLDYPSEIKTEQRTRMTIITQVFRVENEMSQSKKVPVDFNGRYNILFQYHTNDQLIRMKENPSLHFFVLENSQPQNS